MYLLVLLFFAPCKETALSIWPGREVLFATERADLPAIGCFTLSEGGLAVTNGMGLALLR